MEQMLEVNLIEECEVKFEEMENLNFECFNFGNFQTKLINNCPPFFIQNKQLREEFEED